MSSSNSAAAVYGGDEINAIVLDPGSHTTRIGYAGDDLPRVVAPAWYALDEDGTRLFGGSVDFPKAGRQVRPLMREGLVCDWDAAAAHFRHHFDGPMALAYAEQPLLVTEPVWAPAKHRQRMVETLYEEFGFPAVYLAKTPTCVSFQQGRPSCLVVDVGHDSASVVPVVDGMCLLKHSMRTGYAGRFLNDHVADTLAARFPGVDLLPQHRVLRKTPVVYPAAARFEPRVWPGPVAPSFDEYQRQRVFCEFKELMLEAGRADNSGTDPADTRDTPDASDADALERTMELPAGQTVAVARDRLALADALFEPALHPFHDAAYAARHPACNGEMALSSPYDDYRPTKRARKPDTGPHTPLPAAGGGPQPERGLAQLVAHALASVDVDLRTALAHNVVVTGGTSLVPRLTERLSAELQAAHPGLKVRLHAPGSAAERTGQAWLGGSVLASLGAFHQMWVSKAEYDEAGAERILTQRFR
ncbi:Actin/actin-like protein [Metschnikowia bicuspidata var. bicuspidata NRRL YB-4993]|uniref:Actin-related protein 4 n=1 Tax=Metschnikowia bicuspidata var. bicuspidata NRRL YB-4993 TaxID=869754 RepID=A0A1A0GZ20_9ASCO|nr:Actin/actin-like protein [Metschnikowia bicuspidata var. bicuspidata NRRL YB-4993]OBA16973.1 Actin/actin-like protein [Metschnikowia bicuspidata var. bicuspidata NRRL YB-4993]